ncbi:hypothetical protein THRCLA_09816 [Thraustotheca clavata]|uniref:C3H1-type domain-containing protein n=1 Tax=Thraustotheca clavata TaxID=74557 RepID=A0A1V9YU27_9STRA|nr:hypothetical protein THRCLA_09816 [Thraustotheca clavata]
MATTWKEGEAELKAALAPIASAKGTSATKIKVACSLCMKLVKDYKRVVHAVETVMWKSEVEHRLGFLYLIDAITRASQSKYGPEKDLFSPRFGIHLRHTISSVKQVPAENQHHVYRVIQDWIARSVFTTEEITKAGGAEYLKPVTSQSSVPSTPTTNATPLNSEAEKEKLAQLLDNIKRIKQQREEKDKSPPPPLAPAYNNESHNYAPEQNNVPPPGQNTYQQSSYSYAAPAIFSRPPPSTSSRPSRFDQQPPPVNSRRDSPRKPRGRSRSRSRSPRRVRARSRSRSGARDNRSRRPEPILSQPQSYDQNNSGYRNHQSSPSSYQQQAQSFNSTKYNAPPSSYNPPPSSYNPPPSSYNAASPTFSGASSNGQTYQQGGFTKGTCRDFAQGRCFRGANCRFPHDQSEIPPTLVIPRVPTPPRTNPAQTKTKLCVNYPGSCRFGDRCSFAHGEGQLGQAIPVPIEKEKYVQSYDNRMYEEAPKVHIVAPSPKNIPKREERESSPPKQLKRQSRWGAKPPTVPETTEEKPVDEEETALPAPEFTLEYDDDD